MVKIITYSYNKVNNSFKQKSNNLSKIINLDDFVSNVSNNSSYSTVNSKNTYDFINRINCYISNNIIYGLKFINKFENIYEKSLKIIKKSYYDELNFIISYSKFFVEEFFRKDSNHEKIEKVLKELKYYSKSKNQSLFSIPIYNKDLYNYLLKEHNYSSLDVTNLIYDIIIDSFIKHYNGEPSLFNFSNKEDVKKRAMENLETDLLKILYGNRRITGFGEDTVYFGDYIQKNYTLNTSSEHPNNIIYLRNF